MENYLLFLSLAMASWIVATVYGAYKSDKAQWTVLTSGCRGPPTFINWLRYTVSVARLQTNRQRGSINIAGLMMMGIAMIFLAVGFIIYPIVLDSTDTILAWTYTGTTANATISTFTGLEPVTGITPLIVLLGFVVAGAISGFMGIRMLRSGEGSLNPASLMMLGIGLIFIAVALIIFPVVLDGVATAMDSTSIATYTGLESILKVTPLIVLTAFLTGGVVAGFFGIRMGLQSQSAI